MLDWRIYFADGNTFDSTQGAPEDAPALGVVAIVCRDPDPHGAGRYVLHGGGSRRTPMDYYWFDNGEWYGGDLFGLFDFLMRRSRVKFGRTISNATFAAIIKRATDDPDFTPKPPG